MYPSERLICCLAAVYAIHFCTAWVEKRRGQAAHRMNYRYMRSRPGNGPLCVRAENGQEATGAAAGSSYSEVDGRRMDGTLPSRKGTANSARYQRVDLLSAQGRRTCKYLRRETSNPARFSSVWPCCQVRGRGPVCAAQPPTSTHDKQ